MSKEPNLNMGLSVKLMIIYAIHTFHWSNRVKYFHHKILIGKAKARRNNYYAQLEHVAKRI
jgi:hypothetical protein